MRPRGLMLLLIPAIVILIAAIALPLLLGHGDSPGGGTRMTVDARNTAAIDGRLLAVGGPPPGAAHGTQGRIEVVTTDNRDVARADAGATGDFAVQVPPGRYVFKGYLGDLACPLGKPVDVRSGHSTVRVVCGIK